LFVTYDRNRWTDRAPNVGEGFVIWLRIEVNNFYFTLNDPPSFAGQYAEGPDRLGIWEWEPRVDRLFLRSNKLTKSHSEKLKLRQSQISSIRGE
jgi:hypothetical protein